MLLSCRHIECVLRVISSFDLRLLNILLLWAAICYPFDCYLKLRQLINLQAKRHVSFANIIPLSDASVSQAAYQAEYANRK